MQHPELNQGGLGQRLARLFFIAVLAAFAAGEAFASNALGVAFDPAFGTNGFTPLPAHANADAGTTITPIGIVHLDVAGGYVAASMQRVSGNYRMVLTRYTENGAVDGSWGTSGSQLPALPSPYLASSTADYVRIVAGRESGQDIFYLAFSLFSSPDLYIAVAKFQASGAFDPGFGNGGYAVSKLPASAPVGLLTLQGAAFTEVFGLPVLVVAVNAVGNRLVFTRAHGTGTAALSDQGGGSSLVLGATPTFMQARTFGPNHIELVGAANNDAFYIDYDAGTLTASTRVFRLPCPSGSNWSAIDAIARPAAFGGDALVVGRSSCIGQGVTSIVARVADIATTHTMVWSAQTETNSACNSSNSPCPAAMLAYDDAHPQHALTVTPLGYLAPVRLADGATLPTFGIGSIGGPAAAQPSTYRGIAFRWPRLVGFGVIPPSTQGVAGLVLDGIFGDGFD
jgi:hypothetical protein